MAVAVGAGHAQRAKAARRELVDRLVDARLAPAPALADSARITCGAPLVTLNVRSVRGRDGGLGAFVHRVERLEVDHLVALQRLVVVQAAEDGQVDGVVVVGARRQRGVEDDLLGGDVVHG